MHGVFKAIAFRPAGSAPLLLVSFSLHCFLALDELYSKDTATKSRIESGYQRKKWDIKTRRENLRLFLGKQQCYLSRMLSVGFDTDGDDRKGPGKNADGMLCGRLDVPGQ